MFTETYVLYYDSTLIPWGFIHIRESCDIMAKIAKYFKIVKFKENNRRTIIDDFTGKSLQVFKHPHFTFGHVLM